MIFSAIAIIAAAGVAYFAKLPVMFGAHPFWGTQVLMVWAAIGFVFSLRPIVGRWKKIGGFAILAALAYAIAHYGKTQFAASYAEDAIAGNLWYFGWHGTTAFLIKPIGSTLKR